MTEFKLIRRIVDNRYSDTYATYFRKRRFSIFKSLLSKLHPPIRILDIGGTQEFWENMDFNGEYEIHILLLNLIKNEVKYPNFVSLIGDGRDMKEFKDNEFDVVFSNSVIEHVGGYEQQCKMAKEIMRVGKRYFIQTPNYYFPIEPHFIFPFFQFLNIKTRVFLIKHFRMGWIEKITEHKEAMELISSIRLLTEKELKNIFINAIINKEKFFGITKSFIVYGGWDQS